MVSTADLMCHVNVSSCAVMASDHFEGPPEETKPYSEKWSKAVLSDKSQKVPTWIQLSLSLAP